MKVGRVTSQYLHTARYVFTWDLKSHLNIDIDKIIICTCKYLYTLFKRSPHECNMNDQYNSYKLSNVHTCTIKHVRLYWQTVNGVTLIRMSKLLHLCIVYLQICIVYIGTVFIQASQDITECMFYETMLLYSLRRY